MIVESSGAGMSVFDLVDAIRRRTGRNPQLHLRITRLVHQTLGDAWRSARNVRFDYEAAKQSLLHFDSGHIPKVAMPLPTGVSDVCFVADMENVASLSLTATSGSGLLFRSLGCGKRR